MATGKSRLELGDVMWKNAATFQFLFSIFQPPFFRSQKIVFPAVPSLYSPPMLAEEINMYCPCSWAVA